MALVILSIVSLFIGVIDTDPGALLTGNPETVKLFLISRVPRLLAILCTGIGLSTAGMIMQQDVYKRQDFPMERFNELTRAFFKEIVASEGLAMKPGVKELLAYAKENGYKLAVASSSRREHAVNLLTEAGVYLYFDGSVFGDMVKNAKPDPEIYRTACEVIQAVPEETVALEDAPAGVKSASGAGLRAIMIPDLVQPDEETMKDVWKKYNTLLDVLELLKEQEADDKRNTSGGKE